MAIRVKHDPSAAAIGETAYTIGRGEKRERERLFALRQMDLAVRVRGQNIQAERSAEQLALRADELGLRGDELEFRKEQWQGEPSRQLQRGLQEQERLKKNIIWQYDEGQKRELAKITTGVAWLREQVAAGKWTAEQAEQAEQQLWQKYYSIIPLPVYDDKAKPQEMYDSLIVTDPITGARSIMDAKGNFADAPGSLSFKDYSAFYAKTLTAMFKQDTEGKDVTDYAAVDATVLRAITRFSQIQGLAARAGQETPEQQPPQISAEEQAKQQAAVEVLPTLFKTLIKGQPKIGRKKRGKPSRDKVYGEEAYNKMLVEAAGRGKQEGIPPDVMKAELDKWWDAQYDKERGQMFQKFKNRLEFEGARRTAAPEARKVAPEVDLKTLDELGRTRVKKFKSGKIVWTAIRKRYGRETADELKYICDSGNEQAIANALQRLGII